MTRYVFLMSLFSNIYLDVLNSQEVCESCVSEPKGCYQSCSFEYTGRIDDNVVELVYNVMSARDCHKSCLAHQDCSYYTFFTEHLQCFLLSKLLEPIKSCDNCVTAPSTCSDKDRCLILYNGTLQGHSYMFTDTAPATAQWGRTRFFWISGLAKVKHRVLYTKVSAKLPHLTI